MNIFWRRKKPAKTHYLSIGAIFKDESDAMVEWLEHYLREGVDHFYMIDNGSSDDYEEKIAPYLSRGLINLIKDDKQASQRELYNKYFMEADSHWLGVFDLDEFAYSPSHASIPDYLVTMEAYALIRICWLRFGSNGHIQQPPSIVEHFTMRQDYGKKRLGTKVDLNVCRTKSIAKVSQLISLGLQKHKVKGKVYGHGKDDPLNEAMIAQMDMVINHYKVQSLEWYEKVKYPRGRATRLEYRSSNYFKKNDLNEREDLRLLHRAKGRAGSPSRESAK